jgi:quinol monooxygenase YgiN/mannose-6-phosphate isomerase-like protein (cupin superfamily)
MTARAGQGGALAEKLQEVAQSLETAAGCTLYLINRSPSDPNVVWVNEIWRTQEALDKSLEVLETEAGKARADELMALLEGSVERIDVEPLGGVGLLAGGTGATIVNLDEVEDQAPKFGYGEVGEARFPNRDLQTVRTGISLQRLRPDKRQAFAHRHHHAEEVCVVLAGSGRVKIDDEIHELRRHDAIRIAPASARAFEAGPDGLELLIVGPRHIGDAELVPEFWP